MKQISIDHAKNLFRKQLKTSHKSHWRALSMWTLFGLFLLSGCANNLGVIPSDSQLLVQAIDNETKLVQAKNNKISVLVDEVNKRSGEEFSDFKAASAVAEYDIDQAKTSSPERAEEIQQLNLELQFFQRSVSELEKRSVAFQASLQPAAASVKLARETKNIPEIIRAFDKIIELTSQYKLDEEIFHQQLIREITAFNWVYLNQQKLLDDLNREQQLNQIHLIATINHMNSATSFLKSFEKRIRKTNFSVTDGQTMLPKMRKMNQLANEVIHRLEALLDYLDEESIEDILPAESLMA